MLTSSKKKKISRRHKPLLILIKADRVKHTHKKAELPETEREKLEIYDKVVTPCFDS